MLFSLSHITVLELILFKMVFKIGKLLSIIRAKMVSKNKSSFQFDIYETILIRKFVVNLLRKNLKYRVQSYYTSKKVSAY